MFISYDDTEKASEVLPASYDLTFGHLVAFKDQITKSTDCSR